MKILINKWQQSMLQFLLYGFVAAIVLSPIASNIDIPASMDLFDHLSSIIQAKLALSKGDFPLRLAVSEHHGWLYPLFQFYSSSTYTIAGFIDKWLSLPNPFIAYKITIFCALIVGGIYMSCLANWLFKSRLAAVLAGIVYLASPYTIILVNHLSAFNEIVALGVLPAVYYYTLKQYDHPEIKTLLLTGFAWYLLATVHLITFLCATFVCLILLIIIVYQNRKWKELICVSVAYVLGCLLALWYLAPIVYIGKYVFQNRAMASVVRYYGYSPSLAEMLSPIANISGMVKTSDGFINALLRIHPSIGVPVFLAASLSIYCFLIKQKTSNKRFDNMLLPLLITFLIVFIIIWSPINFWKWLPQAFLVTQYSWRFMGQLMLIGALLFAWVALWTFNDKLNLKRVLIIALMIMLSSISWLTSYVKKITVYPSQLDSQITTLHYLMDPSISLKYIKFIDNMLIDNSTYKHKIELHELKPILIPRAYADSIQLNSMFLTLQGSIPQQARTLNQRFIAIANSLNIADHLLVPGPFVWTIPLNKNLLNNKSELFIMFKVQDMNNKQLIVSDFKIPVDEIILGGFLDSKKILSIEKTQPYCKQLSNNTICWLDVPSGIQLIELPVFYYPEMLRITLNGKQVAYTGVLYKDYLVPAIVPEAGKLNRVSIQFRGLLWANYLSSAAWQLFGLLVLYIILRKIFYKNNNY